MLWVDVVKLEVLDCIEVILRLEVIINEVVERQGFIFVMDFYLMNGGEYETWIFQGLLLGRIFLFSFPLGVEVGL